MPYSRTRTSLTLLAGALLLSGVLAGCQRHDDSTEMSASSVASSVSGAAATTTDTASAKLQDAASDIKAAASAAADNVSDKSAVAGAKLDDAAITTKVKAALAQDAGLSTLALNVATTGGVVTLAGTVDNEAKHSEIKTVVSGVEGVTSVVDNTTVKSN